MKRHNRSWWMFVLLAVALLVIVPVAGAQDAPPSLPVTPLDRTVELLIGAAIAIAGGLLTSPGTEGVTAILKRFRLFSGIKTEFILLAVALAVNAAIQIGIRAGLENQVTALWHFIEVLAPASVGLISNLFGASEFYKLAAARNVPILGYRRETKRTNEVVGELVQALQKMAAAPVPAAEIEKRVRRPGTDDDAI